MSGRHRSSAFLCLDGSRRITRTAWRVRSAALLCKRIRHRFVDVHPCFEPRFNLQRSNADGRTPATARKTKNGVPRQSRDRLRLTSQRCLGQLQNCISCTTPMTGSRVVTISGPSIVMPDRAPPGANLPRRYDDMNGPGGPRSGKTSVSAGHRDQRSTKGSVRRATSINPARVAGCRGSTGWRVISERMTPPSCISTLAADSPHCRFS
jgi:hypothetical protein